MLANASAVEARNRASSGSIKRVIRGGGGQASMGPGFKSMNTTEEGNIFTRFFFTNK